ncbi:MAG: hypothetical protein ACI9XP_001418 [Lentimonas sp.]|jgi:hypothetical protein
MDNKTQFIYRLILGVIMITGVIFVSWRLLLYSPPFVKVLALGLIIGTSYLVVDYIVKKTKNK